MKAFPTSDSAATVMPSTTEPTETGGSCRELLQPFQHALKLKRSISSLWEMHSVLFRRHTIEGRVFLGLMNEPDC